MQPISTLKTNVEYFIHSRDLTPVLIKSALLAIANIGLGFAIAYFTPLSGLVGLFAVIEHMSTWQLTVSCLTVSCLSAIFQNTVLPVNRPPTNSLQRFLKSTDLRATVVKAVALPIILSIVISTIPLHCFNQAIVTGCHGMGITICSGLFRRYVIEPYTYLSSEVKIQLDTIMTTSKAAVDIILNQMQAQVNALIAENQNRVNTLISQALPPATLITQLKALEGQCDNRFLEILNAHYEPLSLHYNSSVTQLETVAAHNLCQYEAISQESLLLMNEMSTYIDSRRLEMANELFEGLDALMAQHRMPAPLPDPICELLDPEAALYEPDDTTPPEFICPISHHIIYEPVLIAEGMKRDEATGQMVPSLIPYERNLIQNVYNMGGTTPRTRSVLSNPSGLPTDEALRDRIQVYINARPPISA